MGEEEIEEAMKDMAPICSATETGFFVCITGYDNDKRELWQISEVESFFKMLIHKGFISFLEASSSLDGVTRLDESQVKGFPGFGAFEIWMIANGKMKKGKNNIEHSDVIAFLNVLDKANVIGEAIVGTPKRKGFQKSYNLCDGQQKFKGMPKWNSAGR
jgi:hypothetical protein